MKLARRKVLYLAAGSVALPAVSRVATAQTYPTRPVRIIVGNPPGGGADTLARLISEWLSEKLGQQFIVENIVGASINIATEAAANAAADGYTLLLFATTNFVSAMRFEKLGLIRDIAPVAVMVNSPLALVVHTSVPADTIPEFIAYSLANPSMIKIGSFDEGLSYSSTQLFKMMTGAKLVEPPPYRGVGPALAALLSGQVQAMFLPLFTTTELIRAGNLRALAVTSATRADALPNVPSLSEFLPGYAINVWVGIGAPRNTPAAIIEKLNGAINAGLADGKVKARLSDLGAAVLPGSPADFDRLIAQDTDKWSMVLKFVGVKPR